MMTLQIFFNPMKHKINRKWLCPDCPSDEIFFLDFSFPKAQGQGCLEEDVLDGLAVQRGQHGGGGARDADVLLRCGVQVSKVC